MRRRSPELAEPACGLEESSRVSNDDMDLDFDMAMPPAEAAADEQGARVFAPPPHVATRIYRRSQARRRDSSASSRRNSMSSAHSRCSSVHHSGGLSDQSKHVAQHLRRASFLENRRARLADQAAHAERVRLRAALAKAAPRGTSTIEERSLAAQQARERNLAEIVANCAEEVKKAKQVAEFMREKREQDLIKMRREMQERLAEAEKRREELRNKCVTRRSRGQSVMAQKPAENALESMDQTRHRERPKMTEDVAAARLQDWWRSLSKRKAIQDFNGLGLSVDGIRKTSFDTVVQLLGQERVLLDTARLLRMCGLREADPKSVGEMAAVRTFLSAFLILGHPKQVLNNKSDRHRQVDDPYLSVHPLPSTDLETPQLQDLIGKAKDLIVTFENILARLTESNRFTMPPALKENLPEAYAVFHNAFIAWKSRDSNALIEVMLMQFVELDAILHAVNDSADDETTALYRQSIKDNQLMLIVRIKKLAGAEKGKKMIFEAVRDARKSRMAKQEAGDTKPRVAEHTTGETEASATASSLVSAESHTLTPPSTPVRRSQAKPLSAKTGLNGLLPDNRIVVHELAINQEYRIPEDEYKEHQAVLARPLYAQMKAMMNDSNKEANFQFYLLMASSVKEKLQRLVTPGKPMYNLIDEILDPELAQKSFAHGSFSYEKFFSAMGSLLPKLCAPFRDAELQDLVDNKLNSGNLIDRLEALIEFIDVMLCDYINYMLRTAAPKLIESAAQYESKRFTEDIEGGTKSLVAAETAWRNACLKVTAEVAARGSESSDHPKSQPTASRLYAQMLVDVFTQPTPIAESQVPEMLRLDYSRIKNVSTTIQHIITTGAILLQCKNILKRDVRSPWKVEAARIMAVLETNHPSLESAVNGTMAVVEAGRSMPAATKTQLRGLVTKLLMASQAMAQQSMEPQEPVLRLLLTRLRGNLLGRLAPGSATDKVKATTSAGEKLASLGLSEFVERIRQISDLLNKVSEVDRQAHGTWWDAVATKVHQSES